MRFSISRAHSHGNSREAPGRDGRSALADRGSDPYGRPGQRPGRSQVSGNLQFERKGQGVGGMLKRAVTGEGVPLMTVRGQGEAWFAHEAHNCFLVDLEPGDVLTINGRNVLCFDASLSYEIKTVKGSGISGGGLFNTVFSGHGRIGLMCEGEPLVIPVSPKEPVYVDTDAVVGWTASLETSLHRSQSIGSMLRGGSGESVQLMLQGDGFVIVRPSEATPAKPQQH
ncbi:AIM24 family protein [Streptomyces spectabilis]|uniref:AIM24 family protein n=1 Tax=Streptomyces spectabilis TaxID=68270 RepID=A0A5P2WZR5_STRST|nr:AIM24 family protein [Streptomyces spectabilis]